MKIPLEVFVHWKEAEWGDEATYLSMQCDVSKVLPEYVFVCQQTVEVDIPDDFDPIPRKIKTLKEKKKEILATAQVQANNIEEQIQRLLCIEHKPEAA